MTTIAAVAGPDAGPCPGWWALVATMWEGGASPHTIAAALNQSEWADGDRQWHWREISALVAPPAARRRRRPAASPQDRDGSTLLRTLEHERDQEIDLATRIGLCLQNGESSPTIAARLNRLGLRTERGTRWTGLAVDTFIRSGVRGAPSRARIGGTNVRAWA